MPLPLIWLHWHTNIGSNRGSLVGSCLLRLVWIATVFQLFRSTTTLYISYPISWILTALVHFICLMAVRKKLHAESAAMAA